ncbi:AraC family transcriptional regulator [Terrimonas sp.]|uniref:AraC family transcriptional regulator n=1 Tax=Terrimonas sp. TaxID=1914338 RepID=UPI000D519D6C|nr:helix-turn-helix domain-containing protein [Terrimonas sp.]PVD53609.1 AraC family transcriptional regulator [Terrimonas sp.]
MGIKTADIAVYPVSVFNSGNKSFWFGSLERILEHHPFLEHPHKQLFYMLLFVEKANGSVIIDNATIRLDEAKVICIKPNSVFSLDINRTARGFAICFTESFFSLRYNNNVLYQFSFLKKNAESYVRLTLKQTERWNNILQLMQEETSAEQKGVEKVLRSYLNILLYDLDRKFHKHAAAEKVNSKDEKIILFEKLLEENYTAQKTPSFYAKRLHITTNYLNKLCHDYRGVTGGELIRKRITIEAQRLLHYTSLSVAEVAYKLGFESPSYFITFFKKNTGTTPEYFRKSNH